MLKVGLLCGVIAAMSAAGLPGFPKSCESKDCDSRFIVELSEDIENITSGEAVSQQDNVFKSIRRKVNGKASLVEHYSVLSNAFVVSANKDDVKAISSLPGVKTVDELKEHVVKKANSSSGVTFSVNKGVGASNVRANASAETMNKPEGTNEGEGTLIAILDNEFYLRGNIDRPGTAYHHEAYTPLDESVKTRVKAEDIKTLTDRGTHAKPMAGKLQGYEGSLYFNNKVPFYYDYAGDSNNGSSKDLPMDYNVESTLSLHGSHVSSIAGGNAPTYKGIAPKAQLACMKVFSDVRPTPVGEASKNGAYSTFSEEGFLRALEDCVLLNVDAINVSIGSDLDDFDLTSVTMKTLSKIADAGILSAVSAGNGGKSSYAFAGGYGNWTRDMVETGIMGSFANNADIMTVASGQPNSIYFENAFRMGDENIAFEDQIVNIEGQKADYKTEFRIRDLYSKDGTFGWVYVPGFGNANDYNGLDVEGKMAVVNRGSIDFSQKYQNAKDAGAIALIIINNDPTAMDFNFRCSFGDDFRPTMPAALVLFKDKPLFQNGQQGTFSLISKQVSENKAGNTISDFSTEGARFDLDIKPEITTPGTSIRGAVWPQNKEEKETPYSAYEYLNGTSMAAPNYEGAEALVVSKVAKDLIADNKITAEEEKEIIDFRRTVDMRFMSTARPMKDLEANGEDGVVSYTSPRMQGAGMANIEGAYKTDVYLKGSDGDKVLNKSKILLRNNSDIARGNVKLSFTAVNEGSAAHNYNVKLVVMRPASVEANKIVSKDYNLVGEVGDLNLVPGLSYAVLRGGEYVMETNSSVPKYKDVINVSKDLEYYLSPEDATNQTNVQKFTMGYWYYSENNKWEPLPNDLYLSVKDRIIAEVTGQQIQVQPGESLITINPYSLTEEQKDEIQKLYPYGTYIEGYVMLEAVEEGVQNLSIPYLGFYSLTDRNEKMSFSSAPVVEPFSFEKDKKTIYPSDLLNDITKQLLGKDNVNFESMWVAGYAEKTSDIDVDSVLTNDDNFMRLKGFSSVGTNPYTGEATTTPVNDIYVGNPHETNTMVIQQCVMRSVKDNYFTITNSKTGKVVYRSALQDMLFGGNGETNPLYKSHVDADYIGGGYMAHRAYAIIPLYDPYTKQAFESGDYVLQFNYVLASTSETIKKAYKLHIDGEAPVVNSIAEFKEDGVEKVRITFKDTRVSYAIVGSTRYDVKYDSEKDLYYTDVEKTEVTKSINQSVATSFSSKRLYVAAVDYARGRVGAIVHFDNLKDYNKFTIAQGYGLTIQNDFNINEDGKLEVIELNEFYDETPVTLKEGAVIVKGTSTVTQVEKKKALTIGLTAGGSALLLGAVAALVIAL